MNGKDYEDINNLKFWDKNPRTISKEAYARLLWQIDKLGEYKPMLINQDNIVLGGNMRLRAYKEKGKDKLWVSRVETKNDEEMWEYALSDNDHVGVTDMELIINEMPQLDIDWTKYSVDIKPPENLQDLIDKFTPVEEDEVPELPTEATSKLGEVYQLGRHRLMCGDATKIEDVEKLMDGQKADMVFTDPPYNVDYGENSNPIWGKQRKIENDKMNPEDWTIFISQFLQNIVTVTKGGIYICMSCKELPNVQKAFIENGGHWSSTIIWHKQQLVPGLKDYQSIYEPILYGWPERNDHYFLNSRTETDLWEIHRPSKSELHPTMKPIELCVKAIKNSSKGEDIVLDLFGGSGSTLIACEQTNRTCYMMELDPKYCDVIRKRYENFIQNNKKQ